MSSSQKGVTKKITKPGKGDCPVPLQHIVYVTYSGKLKETGEEFDHGINFDFPLGHGRVIKGWEIAVAGMKKGEHAVVTIPPELGYGAAGSPPRIPPNATLVFQMELVDFRQSQDSLESKKKADLMSTDMERLARVRKEREEAAAKRLAEKQSKEAEVAQKSGKLAELQTKLEGKRKGAKVGAKKDPRQRRPSKEEAEQNEEPQAVAAAPPVAVEGPAPPAAKAVPAAKPQPVRAAAADPEDPVADSWEEC